MTTPTEVEAPTTAPGGRPGRRGPHRTVAPDRGLTAPVVPPIEAPLTPLSPAEEQFPTTREVVEAEFGTTHLRRPLAVDIPISRGHRVRNRAIKLVAAAGLVVTGGLGLRYVIGLANNSAYRPSSTESFRPVDATFSAAEIQAMNEVPLNVDTIAFGRAAMKPSAFPVDAEHPYGYNITFQEATLVAIEQDPDGSLWLALTDPGDSLVEVPSQESTTTVRNLDGSTTTLRDFRGLTVWLHVPPDISFLDSQTHGMQTGIAALKPYLKVGMLMGGSVNFPSSGEQNGVNRQNLATLSSIENSPGSPNVRPQKNFVFVPDFLDVNIAPTYPNPTSQPS